MVVFLDRLSHKDVMSLSTLQIDLLKVSYFGTIERPAVCVPIASCHTVPSSVPPPYWHTYDVASSFQSGGVDLGTKEVAHTTRYCMLDRWLSPECKRLLLYAIPSDGRGARQSIVSMMARW